MKKYIAPNSLRLVLALSLMVNLGVVGAVAYRTLTPGGTPPGVNLPRHLALDAEQIRLWHDMEALFLAQLATRADEIRTHRDRMIRAIFSSAPDLAQIDSERAAIARLQDEQQKLVVRQLLSERDLLQPAQRGRLAELLIAQPVGPSAMEQLHRD